MGILTTLPSTLSSGNEAIKRAIITHCGSQIVRGGTAATERIIALGQERGVDVLVAHDGMEIMVAKDGLRIV